MDNYDRRGGYPGWVTYIYDKLVANSKRPDSLGAFGSILIEHPLWSDDCPAKQSALLIIEELKLTRHPKLKRKFNAI